MGSKSGLGLKFLQWFIRGIQFLCCATVLGLFSYFLAALHSNHFNIPTASKAVEGIAGAGVLYTIIGLLLLCCLAGHPFTSFIAIFLDICFIGGFIYVAWANRAGAGSCQGTVNTPFGSGTAANQITSTDSGFTSLPTYRQACQMETASMAVAIIACFFFLLSILVELLLVRNRRKEQRFGPSPANNYTSGSGRKKGFMGRFSKNKGGDAVHDDNTLPQHTSPNAVRQSYNTESTAVGHDAMHNKYGESGYGHEGVVGTNGHNRNVVPATTGHATEGVTGSHGRAHNNIDTTPYPEHEITGSMQPHDNTTHPAGITHHAPITQPAGYRYNDGTYNA